MKKKNKTIEDMSLMFLIYEEREYVDKTTNRGSMHVVVGWFKRSVTCEHVTLICVVLSMCGSLHQRHLYVAGKRVGKCLRLEMIEFELCKWCIVEEHMANSCGDEEGETEMETMAKDELR